MMTQRGPPPLELVELPQSVVEKGVAAPQSAAVAVPQSVAEEAVVALQSAAAPALASAESELDQRRRRVGSQRYRRQLQPDHRSPTPALPEW